MADTDRCMSCPYLEVMPFPTLDPAEGRSPSKRRHMNRQRVVETVIKEHEGTFFEPTNQCREGRQGEPIVRYVATFYLLIYD